jgi:signal transduction histidine kinase
MDNVPALAWIRDAGLRYTYVNRRYADERGQPPAAFIGQPASRFFPPATAHLFAERDREVLARGAPLQYVDQFPSGHWLKIKFPVPDPHGGVGVAGIALDLTERVRLEQALAEGDQRTRALIGRLIAARESERRQLADELHDLIGQNLTALGIDLMALEPRLPAGADSMRVQAMRALVQGTVNSIRGVMTGLRPPALEEFGLAAALRAHVADFAARTGIRVDLEVSEPETRLAAEVELALFRIAQEALTNVAKHAGASRARLCLEKAADRVTLIIEDDGCGMHAASDPERTSWGMAVMRERAVAAGGAVRVESPGRGTRIVVEVAA